jgi:hypothetical protein
MSGSGDLRVVPGVFRCRAWATGPSLFHSTVERLFIWLDLSLWHSHENPVMEQRYLERRDCMVVVARCRCGGPA